MDLPLIDGGKVMARMLVMVVKNLWVFLGGFFFFLAILVDI